MKAGERERNKEGGRKGRKKEVQGRRKKSKGKTPTLMKFVG